jgi:hypothetical protein
MTLKVVTWWLSNKSHKCITSLLQTLQNHQSYHTPNTNHQN